MDILELKIMTAGTSGERWADIDVLKKIPVVQIFVNHTDLRTLIKPIELPFALLEEDPDTAEEWAGDYGCIPAEELWHELKDISGQAELFVCPACGESGCWSVACTVTEEDTSVIWRNFRHSHRNWRYPFAYEFSKENYLAELKKLKSAF